LLPFLPFKPIDEFFLNPPAIPSFHKSALPSTRLVLSVHPAEESFFLDVSEVPLVSVLEVFVLGFLPFSESPSGLEVDLEA
jgi:hypothetical protein